MSNMKNIINTHNKKTTYHQIGNIAITYNCIRKHQYILKEKCLTGNVLCKANITPKICYDVSETAFKLRYIRSIKKHSISSNTKPMQNYQTNIGISYLQTKLQTYPGEFWETTNPTTKVLNDVFYV